MIEQLRQLYEDIRDLPSMPSRLECAADVCEHLRDALPAAPPSPPWAPSTATFTGVPIVPRDDMPPGAWRLLAVDGQVLREGTMEPGMWGPLFDSIRP